MRAFAIDAHEALGYRKRTECHIYLRFLCLLAAVDRAVVRGLVHVDLCDGQALFAQVIEEVARKILGSGAKRHDGECEAFVLQTRDRLRRERTFLHDEGVIEPLRSSRAPPA